MDKYRFKVDYYHPREEIEVKATALSDARSIARNKIAREIDIELEEVNESD